MATIASLGVSLTARIGNFEKGFKRARKIVNSFSNDMVRHVGTVAKYGAAITGIAVGALSYLVKGQLEAVDSASKLSRTLGLTTEELVGYQHAASLAGVDAEKLAAGILKVNKSADAATANLSTNDRILAIAEQYKSINNAADRAAFLTKKFGKAGLEMGALFEQGAAGILAARKEAETLGLTFSAIDGISIENANDAVTRLGTVITGVARRIAVQLAPFIEVVSNRLIAFAQNGNKSGEVIVNAANYMTRAFGKLADIFELLKAGWYLFQGAVLGGVGLLLQGSNLIAQALGKIAEVLGIERMEGFADAFNEFADSFTDASLAAFETAGQALDKFASGENAKKMQTFFEGIRVEAAKTAAATALSLADVGAAGASSLSAKTAEFRQVDLSRVAIGGPSGAKSGVTKGEEQIVAQQKTTNSYLSVLVKRPLVV